MKGPRSVAAAAALGNMLNGWDSAALAGALLFLEPEFNLETQPVLEGFIAAASLVGAAISTTFAGSGADWLGRRRMLCISATVFCIGALLMLWSPNVYMLLVARLVDGVGVGLAVTVAPMYISEVAPSEIRGELNTFPQFAGTAGMFLVYCVSFGITLTENPSWRIMLGIILLPSLLYLSLGVFYMPESPRWLVSKGRTQEARQVLQILRNKEDVSGEMALLIEGLGVGEDAVLEEYVLQPADLFDESPAAAMFQSPDEPHIKIFDTEDGTPWIAKPISSYKGSQGFLSRPASLMQQVSRRQSIPLMDTLVPLMGSIKDMADHIAAFEGMTSNQNLDPYTSDRNDEEAAGGYAYASEDEPAGAMDESLTTPMLSRQTTGQWEEENLSRANSAMARSVSGVSSRRARRSFAIGSRGELPVSSGQHGSFVGSTGVGGGWSLAWQWTGGEGTEGKPGQGEYRRIYLFQGGPAESSQVGSAYSLPRYGTMSGLEPIQAAALVSRPSQYGKDISPLKEQVGPALLHPAATARKGPVWSELLEGGVKQALVVGVTLQILEQFGGINAVLNFTPQILQQSGAEVLLSSIGINSNSASVLTSAVINLLCLPCIFVAMRLMDSLGRRTILLRTLPLLIAALLVLVIINIVPVNEAVFASVSVLCVLVYVGLFVMGFGPIPNMLCAEIFPTGVRGVCIGICQAAMWITDILVTELFPTLNSSIGIAGTFGVFAAFCFISWVFIFLKVPETKGMPLEVIVEFFALSAAGKKRAANKGGE